MLLPPGKCFLNRRCDIRIWQWVVGKFTGDDAESNTANLLISVHHYSSKLHEPRLLLTTAINKFPLFTQRHVRQV